MKNSCKIMYLPGGMCMLKKIIISIPVVIIFFSLSLTTFAATSSSLCLSEPQLIESDSNCDYYLNENKLLKIQKISEGSANHPNISLVQSYNQLYEVTKTINVSVYVSDDLPNNIIESLKSGNLTASNQAVNYMGNVRTTLHITYSWNSNRLRMISASSEYEILNTAEGVIPKTSSLYWRATGDIYSNNIFSYRGEVGNTISYQSPSFSNVSLMPSNQNIDAILAGATYTLYCTRSVTIPVSVTIVG